MASANSQAQSQPRKHRNWHLTDEILRGFDRYKYSSQDTSPLAIYVLHPFWNWVVNLIPQWVAPNLLTFLGFLCVVAYYFLIAYYDPKYNSEDGLAAPGWIWLLSGLLNFAAHTLDGIDGKQARRTGTGSPLGELFDHGLDSWTTGMFTASIYSLFGATGIYGISRRCYFYVSLFVLFNFISAHWEKYNTGLFCLPWTYDLSLTLITFIYIFAFACGNSIYHISFALPSCVLQLGENIHVPEWFAVNVLGRPAGATLLTHAGYISVAELLSCFTVLSSLLLGFCYSAYHVMLNGKRGSFMEIVRPLVPCFTLFVLLAIWITASPSNIIDNYPRLVYWALGTTFAQTTSRLIVAQMSSTRCQLSHSCLFVLALCVAFCCLAIPKLEALQQLALAGGLPPHVVATVFNALRAFSVAQLEMYVLQGYAAFVTIVHILYGAFVVYELRCHLNIRAFHIPHGAATARAAASSRPDASKKNK